MRKVDDWISERINFLFLMKKLYVLLLVVWCPPEGDSQLWLPEKYYNNNFAIIYYKSNINNFLIVDILLIID